MFAAPSHKTVATTGDGRHTFVTLPRSPVRDDPGKDAARNVSARKSVASTSKRQQLAAALEDSLSQKYAAGSKEVEAAIHAEVASLFAAKAGAVASEDIYALHHKVSQLAGKPIAQP
jgi:hypothetical protein